MFDCWDSRALPVYLSLTRIPSSRDVQSKRPHVAGQGYPKATPQRSRENADSSNSDALVSNSFLLLLVRHLLLLAWHLLLLAWPFAVDKKKPCDGLGDLEYPRESAAWLKEQDPK